ncbi:hypothetical protein Tco_1390424, partial [Tanacetum coccineum]
PPRSPTSQPPRPPHPAGASGAPALAQQFMAWTTSDTRYESTGITGDQELSPSVDLMHDDSAPDEQVQVSDDQDSEDDHTPAAVDSRKDWWKPLPEEERPVTPKPAWTILPSNVSDAYEVVKVFYPDIIHLQFQIEECHKMLTDQVDWANPEGDQVRINVNRPLPLGAPPGHVTIQTEFFLNKDLEYLRFSNKGSMHVLSISKMKAASYPDFGLELLVPEQMWIEDVCTYDISANEIVLRRADFQEHTIAEKDFKNLYPSDFEDLNLLLLQDSRNSRSSFWIEKDVTRSKEFITEIERRMKTRSIYRNLECFVGGCVRDIDYRLLHRTE